MIWIATGYNQTISSVYFLNDWFLINEGRLLVSWIGLSKRLM